MDRDLLLLFQLADSAFPVGGFAYSYGLESAAKLGFIRSEEDLRKYLITFSQQLISFDFPFISDAFRIDPYKDSLATLKKLLGDYDAMLMNPMIKKSGCVIGRNWIRISKQFSDSFRLEELDSILSKKQLSYDFPVVYGMTIKILKVSFHRALYLYFYMALRDQISALIRLGLSGPSRAHIELRYILDSFADTISSYIPVSHDQAYKSAYLLEIAQLSHDRVYSKLFQN
jgi:urease accessory protein